MFDFLGLPTGDQVPLLNEEEAKHQWQSRRKKAFLFPPKPKPKPKPEDEVDSQQGPVRMLPRKLPKKPVVKMILDSSASALVSPCIKQTLIIFSNTAYCLHIFLFQPLATLSWIFVLKVLNIELFLKTPLFHQVSCSLYLYIYIIFTCLNLNCKS